MTMRDEGEETPEKKERRRRRHLQRGIFAICGEAGIGRADRIELAKDLLHLGENGLESYNELETEDLEDIFFALKGWRTIQELRLATGSLEAEARVLLGVSDDDDDALDGDAGVRD